MMYQKYIEKKEYKKKDDYDIISNYLLDEKSLVKNKKPIMWIYIPHEYNSRKWLSFGSRSSFDLNQPYLYLTVKSIIKNCDNSFKICFIDDNSFKKLIPGWNIEIQQIGEPNATHIRQLAIMKLLYNYGGINVPLSFLCFKDLIEMYKTGVKHNKPFVCENINSNITSTNTQFYPDSTFMGANKENDILFECLQFMEQNISFDFTANSDFSGDLNKWCENKIKHNKMKLISGIDVGVKTLDEKPILVEDLFSRDYINFYPNMYGIWIPYKTILKRNNYEWFARMNTHQIIKSDFILAKYIILATAPDSKNGVIESNKETPEWISFWRTPNISVWGQMPTNLGNNVKQETYPNY